MQHHIIYKYRLETDRIQDIQVPRKAVLLHVGEQGGDLYLWAMHNVAEDRKTARRVSVVGTGYSVPQDAVCNYLGTVQMQSGLVWHVFDNGEIP